MPRGTAARRAAYELQVRALASVARQLLDAGWSEERVARHLVAVRNRLKLVARKSDDPEIVRLIEARNFVKYGDAIGPTADQLFRRYGTWRGVIEATSRPSRLS